MTRALQSDALPLLLLLLIAIEAVGLVLLQRRTGHGPSVALTLSFLSAGAGFAAALFFHRRAGGTLGFALALCAAGIMHVWHLRLLARVPRPSHK